MPIDDLSSALSFDPIAEAERRTGQSYKENDSVTWLGMALMQQQRETTNALLFLNGDTNSWNQTREEWIEVAERMGFGLLLCEDIAGTEDKLRIWWRAGVLLVADSYCGDKSINSAKAYFNFHGPRDAMERCSNGWACDLNGNPVWEGSKDAREGLRHCLVTLTGVGSLLEQWIQQPFLWLLSYMDTRTPGYDHRAINQARIAKLPPHVQTAILHEPHC